MTSQNPQNPDYTQHETERRRERVANEPAHGWTCFHCGETFTNRICARDHFGADETREAACQIKTSEGGIIARLRTAEDMLSRYRIEDSDADRRYYAQQAEHASALRREEERGYERGVQDARAEIASDSLAVAERLQTALRRQGVELTSGQLLAVAAEMGR